MARKSGNRFCGQPCDQKDLGMASGQSPVVMPGLDPGIHVRPSRHEVVDVRAKPGHDEKGWGVP
jgi:hypothetical protein